MMQDNAALKTALESAHHEVANLARELEQKEAEAKEAYAQMDNPERHAFLDGLTGDLEEKKERLERVGSLHSPFQDLAAWC